MIINQFLIGLKVLLFYFFKSNLIFFFLAHPLQNFIPLITAAGSSTAQPSVGGTFLPNFNYLPFGQTQGIPSGQPGKSKFFSK